MLRLLRGAYPRLSVISLGKRFPGAHVARGDVRPVAELCGGAGRALDRDLRLVAVLGVVAAEGDPALAEFATAATTFDAVQQRDPSPRSNLTRCAVAAQVAELDLVALTERLLIAPRSRFRSAASSSAASWLPGWPRLLLELRALGCLGLDCVPDADVVLGYVGRVSELGCGTWRAVRAGPRRVITLVCVGAYERDPAHTELARAAALLAVQHTPLPVRTLTRFQVTG